MFWIRLTKPPDPNVSTCLRSKSIRIIFLLNTVTMGVRPHYSGERESDKSFAQTIMEEKIYFLFVWPFKCTVGNNCAVTWND